MKKHFPLRKALLAIPPLLFLLSLPWCVQAPTRQELSVEIQFSQPQEGILPQFFWGGPDGQLSPERCVDGALSGMNASFPLPSSFSPGDLGAIRVDPSNTETPYSIHRILFLLNGSFYRVMAPEEILDTWTPYNATFQLVSKEELLVTPENADSGLFLSSAALTEETYAACASLRRLKVRERIAFAFFACLAACALVFFFPRLRRFTHRLLFQQDGKPDFFTLGAVAILGAALIAVTVISLFSPLGVHPDESDVKACLDYGMTHFFPPDMRDPAVAGTYSGYGYTKLENYTWYFFLAGKVALLFRTLFCDIAYYRIPNLLLFWGMWVFVLTHVKKHRWLLAAFGICVQSWYLFSYTTADALDFVFSFWAVWELAVPDSFVRRSVWADPLTGKDILRLCLAGILFGMIFLGKPNYWAILALAFFVFLLQLFASTKSRAVRTGAKTPAKSESGRRGQKGRVLLRGYGIILAAFLLTAAFRGAFDLAHYGTEKAAVKTEAALRYADADKNPATPVEEQSRSWHLRDKGLPWYSVFTVNPDWLSMTWRSLIGYSPLLPLPVWYQAAMGLLYLAIYLSAAFFTFRTGPGGKGEKTALEDARSRKVLFALGSLLMAAGLAASVLNSWLVDSQAQGRYLLPAMLIGSYLVACAPQMLSQKGCRSLLLAAGALSAWYFLFRGMPSFF